MRIAIGPTAPEYATSAVEAGGGQVVELGQPADGLVWVSPRHLTELRAVLDAQPGIRWVQLPFAGVEDAVASGVIDGSRAWTCAKGCYAKPVAEHALMLALAGLRLLPERIRATSWGRPDGTSLYGARVSILGGGGITEELLRILAPFGVRATVVRRRASDPVPLADEVVDTGRLSDALPGSLVVFLALALTPATRGIIGAAEMDLIGPSGWLVNVARGGHVDTDALGAALAAGRLGGAALDVTDPEPLPEGHPLWREPRCIITPHTADTWDMILPPLTARISANVAHFAAGEPLEGVVDPQAGY
ncbi:MAG: D-isomer specific 2-hydroxyacid dehydrogenase family protein [Actinomycetota bacterium]|nr:D-isomer specific 2-hydroxyacid dehydrogenase family protein [Actinomycetota bacterium]